ncbi:putative photosystem II reaction center W protein, chloroplastic [Iris pallida]|uniref:PSII 6.1 kDa protein n=1 Tax=Iris pallida TaxID=29817 RepID=A0AAX6HBJ1_IRIPA|nr:putative photosystem II reaction center W protein, chloroplastic [Iris pallida]
MATISASALASTVTRTAAAVPKATPAVLGLPHIGARGGRVRCSAASTARGGGGTSLLGAAAGMIASVPSPVLALVDERMSTEGTGLSLGLSSNLLGWILLGVFGLVWALYFVYTSGLEEDEESGLSL